MNRKEAQDILEKCGHVFDCAVYDSKGQLNHPSNIKYGYDARCTCGLSSLYLDCKLDGKPWASIQRACEVVSMLHHARDCAFWINRNCTCGVQTLYKECCRIRES